MTGAAEMLVQQKMDKLKGIYKEAIDKLKALSSQLTDLPATDLIKKVDQIVSKHACISTYHSNLQHILLHENKRQTFV